MWSHTVWWCVKLCPFTQQAVHQWDDVTQDKSSAWWALILGGVTEVILTSAFFFMVIFLHQENYNEEGQHPLLTCLPETDGLQEELTMKLDYGCSQDRWLLPSEALIQSCVWLRGKQPPQRQLQLFCIYTVQWLLLTETVWTNLQKAG